jgi:DNA-binding CsgD family transcriptional regulator
MRSKLRPHGTEPSRAGRLTKPNTGCEGTAGLPLRPGVLDDLGLAAAEHLAAEVQSSGKPAHEALSNREYQVMLLIAASKVPKEIGDELSLSVKTVGTCRTRILEKLKLKNNAELMRYVLERGLS